MIDSSVPKEIRIIRGRIRDMTLECKCLEQQGRGDIVRPETHSHTCDHNLHVHEQIFDVWLSRLTDRIWRIWAGVYRCCDPSGVPGLDLPTAILEFFADCLAVLFDHVNNIGSQLSLQRQKVIEDSRLENTDEQSKR